MVESTGAPQLASFTPNRSSTSSLPFGARPSVTSHGRQDNGKCSHRANPLTHRSDDYRQLMNPAASHTDGDPFFRPYTALGQDGIHFPRYGTGHIPNMPLEAGI